MTNNLSQLDTTADKLLQMSLDDKDEGLGTSGSNATSNLSNFFYDRRAPGCEMKSLQKQMDYDQKRLLATRAMQSKPSSNEPRTPTPSWSGLGFSSSMPESVIREKMAADDSKGKLAGVAEESEEPWFGNSSALDALLQQAKLNNGQANNILASDDLPTLFSKQGLAKYTDLFVRHEVDLPTFATLTEQDLREIGVQTFGARKKLLLLANSKSFNSFFLNFNLLSYFRGEAKYERKVVKPAFM